MPPESMAYAPPAVRIPGEWELKEFAFGSQSLACWLPAQPDAFLDDEEQIAAHGPSDASPIRSDIPFWQYLWPAAESMARLILDEKWDQAGAALELGCGVGLVGLAALRAGFTVTFTDYQAAALEVAATNARQNGFENFRTELLDWHHPSGEEYPFIFGCEVIYEAAIHEPILNVLDRMLAADGIAWLGDPGRSHLPAFLRLAEQRGYRAEIKNAAGTTLAEPMFGEFQLLVLRKS